MLTLSLFSRVTCCLRRVKNVGLNACPLQFLWLLMNGQSLGLPLPQITSPGNMYTCSPANGVLVSAVRARLRSVAARRA